MPRTPTCVWRISPDLVVALDERFGPPLDAYVNGSQVWLLENGPAGILLEWRLHPVAGFRRPSGATTDELFSAVALAIARGEPPVAPPEQLWDGLEAFPAHGDEADPPLMQAAVTRAVGLPPDAAGLADHEVIGNEWERTGGQISIVERLLSALTA